jgi:uncharacterized protein YceK
MKKYMFAIAVGSFPLISVFSGCGSVNVPQAAKNSFNQKYPQATNVSWEKEKGNYEANWGGTSKEDNSVLYSPEGNFMEIAKAIPPAELPAPSTAYVKAHYKGVAIDEASIVTDSSNNQTYEAEINDKDLVFDKDGNYIKFNKE